MCDLKLIDIPDILTQTPPEVTLDGLGKETIAVDESIPTVEAVDRVSQVRNQTIVLSFGLL